MQTIKGARRRGKTLVSNQAVLQCIIDMHTANPSRPATRRAVSDEMGVPYKLIDEHFDKLLAREKIVRVLPGIFAPVGIRANRAVTGTDLPHGEFKIEIGDQVVQVNMWEGEGVMGQLMAWITRRMPSTQQNRIEGPSRRHVQKKFAHLKPDTNGVYRISDDTETTT